MPPTRTRNATQKRRKTTTRTGAAGLQIERPLRTRREQVFTTLLQQDVGTQDISAPPILAGYKFSVSQFPTASAFLAIFDQYRIRKISVTFMPQIVNNFILSGTVATVVPTKMYNLNTIVTAIDNDDAGTPATEASVLAHETAIMHGPFNKSVTRTFAPMIAASVYQTGGFGGYSSESGQWVDAASNAVEYYGLKWAIANGSTTSATLVNMVVHVQAEVEFRKVF